MSIEALVIAFAQSDESTVSALLSAEPDLLERPILGHPLGWYPLHVAASVANEATVALALSLTRDTSLLTHQRTIYGYEPAHLAVIQGQYGVLKRLLATCGNIHSLTHMHESLVFLAAKYNQIAILRYLLSLQARPFTRTHYEKTPLEIAIIQDHVDCCYVLLQQPETLLQLTQPAKIQLVELALRHNLMLAYALMMRSAVAPDDIVLSPDMSLQARHLMTLLSVWHQAPFWVRPELSTVLDTCLESPIDSPLFLIAMSLLATKQENIVLRPRFQAGMSRLLALPNNITLVKHLLKAHMPTFCHLASYLTQSMAISFTEFSVLLEAALVTDDCEAVDVLIQCFGKEDSLSWRDPHGNSLLHLAAKFDAVNILTHLINQHHLWPSPTIVNMEAETVMHQAARYNAINIAKTLVHQYHITTQMAALDMAVREGHSDFAQLLVKAGAKLSPAYLRNPPRTPYETYLRQQVLIWSQPQHLPLPERAQASIKYLVFQGGGVKGIAFHGAMQRLVESNLLDLSKLTTVAGTSAGAISALLLAVGYNLQEFGDILQNINFYDLLEPELRTAFFDIKQRIAEHRGLEFFLGRKFYNLLRQAVTGRLTQDNLKPLIISLVSAEALWGCIDDLLVGLGIHGREYHKLKEELELLLTRIRPLLTQFKTHQGIFAGEILRTMFMGWLIDKNLSPLLTFRELHDLALADNTYKDLYVSAYNRKAEKTIIFSYETMPDMPIVDAVRASMSIQVFFYSQSDYIMRNGVRFKQDNGVSYFDGGSLNNYFLGDFDQEKYIYGYPCASTNKMTNPYAIGLRLVEPDLYNYYVHGRTRPTSHNVDTDIAHFLMDVVTSVRSSTQQEGDFDRRQDEIERTVFINTEDVSAIDFNLTEAKKQRLIDNGIEGGELFARRYQPQTTPADRSMNFPRKNTFAHYMTMVQASDIGVINAHLQRERLTISAIRDDEGNTLLHRAIRDGDREMIIKLYPLFSDAHVGNDENMKPLDLVIYCKDAVLRESIINMGVRSTWRSTLLEESPIPLVTLKQKIDYLLQRTHVSQRSMVSIAPSIPNIEKQSILVRHLEQLAQLTAIEHSPKRLFAFVYSCMMGKRGDLLKKHNLSVDLSDPDGLTVLHHAVINNQRALLQYCFECHASLNCASNNGEYALDFALKIKAFSQAETTRAQQAMVAVLWRNGARACRHSNREQITALMQSWPAEDSDYLFAKAQFLAGAQPIVSLTSSSMFLPPSSTSHIPSAEASSSMDNSAAGARP